MATIAVVNMKGEEVGKHELSNSVFGIKPNEGAVHLVVVNHLANCRQGTQSTLTRSEVRGGGRKPWRQKGTGRARQGSIRAPQWTHGGVALGPKPRSYGFSVNKKVRRLAMKSVLSDKVLNSNMIVVDRFWFEEYRTKRFVEMLSDLKIAGKALFVLSEVDKKLIKSASNVVGIKTANVCEINVYDILNNESLVFDLGALQKIEEVYA